MHAQPYLRARTRRIRALAARYRGCCICCGAGACDCGEPRIGVYQVERDSIQPYGYRLDVTGPRCEFRPVAAELETVRRVFALYLETGAIGRTVARLEAEGHGHRSREWCSRVLRCDLHAVSGELAEGTWERVQDMLDQFQSL